MQSELSIISYHAKSVQFFQGEKVEDIIEKIEYLLRNGANGNGVQREVDEIVPEIEALLEELKGAIKEERIERELKDKSSSRQ